MNQQLSRALLGSFNIDDITYLFEYFCSYIIKIMSGIREKNAQTIIIQKKIIIYLLISGERALNLKCKFFIFKINSFSLSL